MIIVDLDAGSAYSADDLKTHLTKTFKDYDIRIRPMFSDQSKAVEVTMDLYLVGINNFDSSGQKLTTTAFLDISKCCFSLVSVRYFHKER